MQQSNRRGLWFSEHPPPTRLLLPPETPRRPWALLLSSSWEGTRDPSSPRPCPSLGCGWHWAGSECPPLSRLRLCAEPPTVRPHPPLPGACCLISRGEVPRGKSGLGKNGPDSQRTGRPRRLERSPTRQHLGCRVGASPCAAPSPRAPTWRVSRQVLMEARGRPFENTSRLACLWCCCGHRAGSGAGGPGMRGSPGVRPWSVRLIPLLSRRGEQGTRVGGVRAVTETGQGANAAQPASFFALGVLCGGGAEHGSGCQRPGSGFQQGWGARPTPGSGGY